MPGARTTIFGNVSRSVATPTAQDLYYFYDDGSFRSAGNANLRPERALTFELGARQARLSLAQRGQGAEVAEFQRAGHERN